MYQTIKTFLGKAFYLLRIRNQNQLNGPTLMRTNGIDRAPKHFTIRNDQFQQVR